MQLAAEHEEGLAVDDELPGLAAPLEVGGGVCGLRVGRSDEGEASERQGEEKALRHRRPIYQI